MSHSAPDCWCDAGWRYTRRGTAAQQCSAAQCSAAQRSAVQLSLSLTYRLCPDLVGWKVAVDGVKLRELLRTADRDGAAGERRGSERR